MHWLFGILQCPVLPACLGVLDFSVVVGLLWGLAGYWQHPSMGQRWQFPSCSLPASTRCYSPDLKRHKQQITWVRQQGKKSHITQRRLGWTNPSSAAWRYSTQTWRAVSHGPVWARLGSCRQHFPCKRLWEKTQLALMCTVQIKQWSKYKIANHKSIQDHWL